MRTIDIDDDLYVYIASQTKEIGESAADILRRLLGVTENSNGGSSSGQHELSKVLENPGLKYKSAVDKFLFVLSEAYKLKPETFDKILTIQGRGRKYFAPNRSAIEASGNSTQPKQISGTSYWVMTNSPTPQKATMLRQALEAVGFSKQASQAASRVIR